MSSMLFDIKYYFETKGKRKFTDDWRSWCRICAKPDAQQYVDVLSGECLPSMPSVNCSSISLVSEIEQLFRIYIKEYDNLSSWICINCFQVVKYFQEIKEDTKKVQQLYYDLLNSVDPANIKNELSVIQKRSKQTVEEFSIANVAALSEFGPSTIPSEKEVTNNSFEKVELAGRKNDHFKTDSSFSLPEIYNTSGNEYYDAHPSILDDTVKCDYSDSDDSTDINNENKYTCDICQQSYQRKCNYTSHMIKKHNYVRSPEHYAEEEKELIYPCPQCDQKFRAKGRVAQHLLLVHKDEKPFICEVCGAKECTNQLLQEHMTIHKDYMPFECEVCGKCFKKKKYLKSHMYIHGDKLMCPKCGEQLSCPTTYRNHMLVHSDERSHKCEFCGLQFKRANTLKAHLIRHTGMRPYTCDFCDKTYSAKSNCTMHMKKIHPHELAGLEASGGKKFTYVPKVDELKSLIHRNKEPVNLRRGRKVKLTTELPTQAKQSGE
ncbi:zinc finger protein 675 [Ceratitis capitata]|uniref:zinc finger protein 675 n=1 Tax=Ceratitis capitata TaxID=7213 RepID=UPI000329CA34|nr:zinc finger protein 675 [Ceratitis capitata]